VPVIAHAIQACLDLGMEIDYVCCIYPCTPFLRIDDLISTFQIIHATKANYIYPVTEFTHPIQRAMRQLKDGSMQFLNPQFELTRTQDLEPTYHDAGQFYWGKASAWLEGKRMHTAGLGFIVPSWRVVDIDTEDDWKRAEIMFDNVR
jgi:pseudaminic acid cytidylyltransferase